MINFNKKIGLLLVSFSFIISCTDTLGDKDLDAPFSSSKWYTSDVKKTGSTISDKNININSYVSFLDVSQGVVSRNWSIPTTGKFLNKKFTEKDSIYTSFIIPNSGTKSKEDLINVLFTESGLHQVFLTDIFKDSVPNSTRSAENWIKIDTFNIDVYADPNPVGKVYRQNWIQNPANPTGAKIIDTTNPYLEILNVTATDTPDINNAATWTEITIEAGEKIKYENLSTIGRTDAVEWTLNGGQPETSTSEIVEIAYNKLTTGDFYYSGSFESYRKGADLPKKAISKLIPLKIKVVPSTQPFILNGMITEDASEVISLNVTGEITTLTGEENNFTVHVVNTTAGFNQNIAVQSATINSSDATQIDLVLSEPIYNSDVITVAYTAGNIGSVDFRVLESFTATNVLMKKSDNIITGAGLDWAGFEVEATTGNFLKKGYAEGYWVGNTNVAFPNFSRTTDKSNSGAASMKYESPVGVTTVKLQGSWFTNGTKSTFAISPLPAGTYDVSYMVYLETGNNMLAFETEVQGGAITSWDVSSLPRGQWVEISNTIIIDADLVNKKFDLSVKTDQNIGVTGKQIMYFDDLSWRLLEVRQ